MRIKSMRLAVMLALMLPFMLALSLTGFEAHGKRPVGGSQKSEGSSQVKSTESDKRGSDKSPTSEKQPCDTLTGIQELESQ